MTGRTRCARLPFLSCLLLVAACGSPKKDRAGEERTFRPPPVKAELPAGTLWRTARKASFEELLDDVAQADVVYLGADAGDAAHRSAALLVLDYLLDRGFLHGLALGGVARPHQAALDAYMRTGAPLPFDPGGWRPLLEDARRARLPMLALDLDDAVARELERGQTLETLPEPTRRALPAIDTADEAHNAFLRAFYRAREDEIRLPFERFALLECVRDEVAADAIVRWFRATPEHAQLLVLAPRRRVAGRRGIPERVRRRAGRTYRTLVFLSEGETWPAAQPFGRAHADYVWIMQPGGRD